MGGHAPMHQEQTENVTRENLKAHRELLEPRQPLFCVVHSFAPSPLDRHEMTASQSALTTRRHLRSSGVQCLLMLRSCQLGSKTPIRRATGRKQAMSSLACTLPRKMRIPIDDLLRQNIGPFSRASASRVVTNMVPLPVEIIVVRFIRLSR